MSWMKKCYSRLLIDNHITDLKPEFMSRFKPANYVEMVQLSGVESSMVYACDHNGNCYYPTKCGHQHANLHGRDIFGETVALLNKENIVPIAYYTIIYHNDSAVNNPHWRAKNINNTDRNGRYRFSCPNSLEYQEFAKKQLEEIIAYPVQGVFIDMTFWPLVCTCENCRKAYGQPIPETIDWTNPEWVRFQRWREKSMADFGAMLTKHIKSIRPELTVTHQFSPVLHGWLLGQCSGTALASDYASGDFYGGKKQQRFGTKVFSAYSQNQPFEFMTSRCVSLQDHTSTKSDDELFLHAVTSLANGGAFFFIDAINPDGTLNRRFYERLHKITEKLAPFRKMIQPHVPVLCGKVGLYFSMNSCVNENLNGINLKDDNSHGNNMEARRNAVVDEAIETAYILNSLHIPYRIITDLTTDYSGFETIFAGNCAYLSNAECERLREFVRNGGTLIATGKTSLYTENGETSGNFSLADVFGVSYSGKDAGKVSYLNLNEEYLTVSGVCAPLVNTAKAEVRGKVTLPYFPPFDPDNYASIHSNPPGEDTEFAGLCVNEFGKGKCVYLYSPLLMHSNFSQNEFGRSLFREFAPEFIADSENLHPCVEITLLKSSVNEDYFLGIVNGQDELPVIPLHDIKLALRLPVEPEEITDQNGRTIKFQYKNNITEFNLESLNEAVILQIREKKR